MDDEIPVVREGASDDDKNKSVKIGCAVVALALMAIPAIVIAIPLIAALYRWAFGG